MKKINKAGQCPEKLNSYAHDNPLDDWDQIRGNNRDAVLEVKKMLIENQRGLCAYCEIDFAAGNGNGLDDFRVEHFIPQRPHHPPPNHALDWFNLRGVCSGGNQKDVCVSERHTSPDHSCDVPKGNKILTGAILDPLHDVPAFPRFFEFVEQGQEAGMIVVDNDLCPTELQQCAADTIMELCLNAERLKRFRKAVIEKLRENVEELIQQGNTFEEALADLAKIFLTPLSNGHWQPFFTCVRWYLGPSAEEHLHSINYQG